jgi:tetratricopeptide (TPR) repeat protein
VIADGTPGIRPRLLSARRGCATLPFVAPDPSPAIPDDPDARIAILRQLAAADPDDATTHFLLGRELLAAREAKEAARAFEAAIRARPDYTAAYRQLGNALEADGRVAEARSAYRRGVDVANRTQDLQAGKEMTAFLKRLDRDLGSEESP